MVRSENPDVVVIALRRDDPEFLDLLGELPPGCRAVVVADSPDEAAKAFAVQAAAYLVEPVDPDRLADAMQRIRGDGGGDQLAYDDRILLPGRNHTMVLLPLRSICWISSAGDYSEVHATEEPPLLVLRTLREWEERLPARQFVRIHRKAIVNVDHIDRIEEWVNSSFRIMLRNQTAPIVSSRRYSAKLRKVFS